MKQKKTTGQSESQVTSVPVSEQSFLFDLRNQLKFEGYSHERRIMNALGSIENRLHSLVQKTSSKLRATSVQDVMTLCFDLSGGEFDSRLEGALKTGYKLLCDPQFVTHNGVLFVAAVIIKR